MKTIFDFPPDQMIRKPIKFTSVTGATEYIDDTPVKPGYVHIITRIAVENLNNLFTRFRVGAYDGAHFQLSEEQKAPAAATLYWTADPIYLSEGENLRVEIVGATPGDVIMVYVDGFFRRV